MTINEIVRHSNVPISNPLLTLTMSPHIHSIEYLSSSQKQNNTNQQSLKNALIKY